MTARIGIFEQIRRANAEAAREERTLCPYDGTPLVRHPRTGRMICQESHWHVDA